MAKLKFVQGVTIGDPGEALFGAFGAEVTASAVDYGSAQTFRFRLVDAPIASTLVPATVQDGALTSYKFTPDVAGGYLFELVATDPSGRESVTYLCFGVKETNGKFIPPFSAKAAAVNFDGQTRGWSRYAEEWFARNEDVIFAIADQSTTTFFARAGGARKLDMSRYPARVGGLYRKVRFVATLENALHSVAYNAEVRLWDLTNGVLVTSSTLDNTGAVDRGVATEVTSAALTVGSAAGNVRSDAPTTYAAEFRGVGVIPGGERVLLGTARIEITYEATP